MVISSDKNLVMDNDPNQIPVDEYLTSYDPNHPDEASSSFSLASSLHDFSYENGRRYSSYRSAGYPFPSDDLSVRNERVLHHMMLFLLQNRLYLAPVKTPKAILDVRCVQGLWAENVAELWENTEVVAMDTTPRERSSFPNCNFIVQSLNDDWVFDRPDIKFDFIYARNIFATSSDYDHVYRQCFENMAPGGYFEQTEIEIKFRCDDDSVRPDSIVVKVANLIPDLSSASGVQFEIAMDMKSKIEKAGFVDVVETKFKLPLGPWSKDPYYKQAGEWFEAFYKSGLQGWLMAIMTRNMGYTPDQVNELCEQAFREVDERRQHHYLTAVVVHARKPS